MAMAQKMSKRHPESQNSFGHPSQRSPVKMQRQPAYSNAACQDMRQSKGSPGAGANIQTLSLLQAQVDALQAQIGMIMTS